MTRDSLPVRGLVLAAKLAITAFTLWYAFRTYSLEWLVGVLSHAAPGWLAAALLLVICQVAVLTRRWQLLFPILAGTRAPYYPLWVAQGRSLLLGQFAPSTIGTDVVRAAAAAGGHGVGLAARTVVCDRLIGFGGLFVLILATLPLAIQLSGSVQTTAILAGIPGVGILALAVLARWPTAFKRIPGLGTYVATVAGDLSLTLSLSRRSWTLLILAVGGHALSILVFLFFARAIGSDVSMLYASLLLPPALLLASLPISLGGWGVREAAIAAAFANLGADPAAGVTASILFGLSSPVLGAMIELSDLAVRRVTRRAKAGRAPAVDSSS